MADSTILPGVRAQLVAPDGTTTREFYRFFSALSVTASLPARVDDLTAQVADLDTRVDAIEAGGGAIKTILGLQSVKVIGPLDDGSVKLSLAGDVTSAPALSFYGAITEYGKGWQTFSGNFAPLSNADGTQSLDLSNLTDSNTGTLQATTFDAKGRKTGSRDATITGTAGRVTVANGNAAVGVPTIDLATVADAGGGALLRFVRDAWGRITGTSAATTTDLTEGTNLYFTDARADARITAQKGIANGLAPLGSDAKINVSYLPAAVLGQVSYQGTWDASAGTPPTATPDKGWYYIVTVAGSTNLSGITDWKVGDWAIYSGTAWDKVDNTDAISTWNGRTGAVVPLAGDYTATLVGLGAVDNTSDANKPVSTAQAAAIATKYDKTGGQITGNIELVGTARRITGQMSNATVSDRLFFQSSIADGFTSIAVMPNGTSTIGAFQAYASSDVNNSSYGMVLANPGIINFVANRSGTGAAASFGISTSGSTKVTWDNSVGHMTPGTDNTQNVGSPSLRYAVIYAGTGTINTSDATEKTAVTPLTVAELAAAAEIARAIGTYQWLASVEDKGSGRARHHAGLTVQRAIEIMQSHGLDPMRYGFICYDRWDESPEVRSEEMGEVLRPCRAAGECYSFRHDELLLFLARGFAARLDALEASQ